jgi:hypothetical protein
MRKLHKFIGVVVLTSTLMVSTFAGQIDLPKPASLTPPSVTTGDTTGVAGQIDLPVADGEISTTAQASDSIVEVALSLVQSVLALF